MTYWFIGCIYSVILYFCGLRIIYGAISQIKFMGPTWAHLSHVAPDGPHVGPINLAIRDTTATVKCIHSFYPNFHLKLFSRHSFLPLYYEKYNIIIQLLISMITGGALIDSYIWSHNRIWISTDDVFILNMITQDIFIHIPISKWYRSITIRWNTLLRHQMYGHILQCFHALYWVDKSVKSSSTGNGFSIFI